MAMQQWNFTANADLKLPPFKNMALTAGLHISPSQSRSTKSLDIIVIKGGPAERNRMNVLTAAEYAPCDWQSPDHYYIRRKA